MAILWESGGRRTAVVILCLCQLGTIVLTWDLWADRTTPPPLPALAGLPSLSMGWPLVCSLVLAMCRPRAGAATHGGVLLLAAVFDQTRLQPGTTSLAILLVACAFDGADVVGRAHLSALWLWAGVNKLASTEFEAESAPFIAEGLGISLELARWLTPLGEIVVGLLALTWRTRHLAIAGAVVVHSGILYALIQQNWNSSVWLWNLALPPTAGHLLTLDRSRRRRGRWRSRIIWTVALVAPAGFYVGAVDAYLAHNLYSSTTRTAVVCLPAGGGFAPCLDPYRATWDLLNVPLPPETRLYRQWFTATCAPGETLEIGPIRSVLTRGDPREVHPCPTPRGP